jgi:hypothetical protein
MMVAVASLIFSAEHLLGVAELSYDAGYSKSSSQGILSILSGMKNS